MKLTWRVLGAQRWIAGIWPFRPECCVAFATPSNDPRTWVCAVKIVPKSAHTAVLCYGKFFIASGRDKSSGKRIIATRGKTTTHIHTASVCFTAVRAPIEMLKPGRFSFRVANSISTPICTVEWLAYTFTKWKAMPLPPGKQLKLQGRSGSPLLAQLLKAQSGAWKSWQITRMKQDETVRRVFVISSFLFVISSIERHSPSPASSQNNLSPSGARAFLCNKIFTILLDLESFEAC